MLGVRHYATLEGAMKSLLVCSFLVCSALTCGQGQSSVTAPWDSAARIGELSAQAARLKPLLEQLTPQQWIAQGAPQAYLTQWQDARKELEYLTAAAEGFAKQPERLTAALDTLFRLQALEWRLESLVEGVRRYQNPAVGDLLLGVLRSNSANGDGLREYITDLAAQKDQEFRIVEQEAQRCRVEVNRTPAPSPARRKGK
jgi:hypothetical protein